MAKPSTLALSQILLHMSPPPLTIAETREVFRAIKAYGEVEVFKVIRHTTTTSLPTPLAHVIFSSPPRTLPPRLTIPIAITPPPSPPPHSSHPQHSQHSPHTHTQQPPHPPTYKTITLTPLPSSFPHHLHVQKTFRTVAAEGIRGLRATIDVPEQAETEEEEENLDRKEGLSERQRREEPGQYGRLLRLYAGGWRGFDTERGEKGGKEEKEERDGEGEEDEAEADPRLSSGAQRRGPRRLVGVDTSRGVVEPGNQMGI
ncbi:hypothetical protein DFH27DRAFT_653857 [Peziza echinospora]|nr:hypothetical protein DFH27DRAFT_653857 [Peziza echinospora]